MTAYVDTDNELLTKTELLHELDAEYKHYVQNHGQSEAEWVKDLRKHSVSISDKRTEVLGSESIVGFSFVTTETIRYKAHTKLAAINEFLSMLDTDTTENSVTGDNTQSTDWASWFDELDETAVDDIWDLDTQTLIEDYDDHFEGHLEFLLTEAQPVSKRQ